MCIIIEFLLKTFFSGLAWRSGRVAAPLSLALVEDMMKEFGRHSIVVIDQHHMEAVYVPPGWVHGVVNLQVWSLDPL